MSRAITLMFAGIAIAITLFIVVRAGFAWQEQRHPPIPPQASKVGELIIPGSPGTDGEGLRQVSYRVALTVEEVRRFYQQELSQLGWHYCGTQATAGCATKQRPSEKASQIDVYQRRSDRGAVIVTVEIKAAWNTEQQLTLLTVVEAVPE